MGRLAYTYHLHLGYPSRGSQRKTFFEISAEQKSLRSPVIEYIFRLLL